MPSFDVISKVNYQEFDNALANCLREISNRYDLAQDCFNFISTRAYLDLNGWSEIDIFRH